MKKILLLFLIFTNLIFSSNRETRAVWITTNFKLDWPQNAKNETEQKNNLRKIFEDLSEKHFNTVYFQVRSNGTVLYNSDIEPFSPYLTNQTGVIPNYDPLQFAIDLGKEFNIEIHAWINMIRCFSGTDERFLKHPKHVRNSHPEWTVRVMDENGNLSYWLNPANYKVQDYLVALMIELTSKYDIDGIHLDFFRYPGTTFDDEKYFKDFGLNVSINDWRRNNLTTILRKFKSKSNPKNKFLKVGATPIGIRQNLDGAVGWEGYSSVFQDTETWLKEELVDYLTPQIYWDFENNPRFDVLANDWVKKSYNKHIILGLAAYKNDTKVQLARMIEYSREINSAGISFFRYDNISKLDNNLFDDLSLPQNMNWKTNGNVIPITNQVYSSYENQNENGIKLFWNDKENFNQNFRNYILLNDDTPLTFLKRDSESISVRIDNPAKLLYNYSVGKLDRLWNIYSISNPVSILIPTYERLKNSCMLNPRPILIKSDSNQNILSVTSNFDQEAILNFISVENIGKQIIVKLNVGINIIPIAEDLKTIKKLQISYLTSNQKEELNFY